MASLAAIAAAIADRFTGLTATVDGSPEPLVYPPTHLLPDGIAKGPVMLVYPPEGDLEIGVSKRVQDLWDFPVRLIRDPVSTPARTAALYAWMDAMRLKVPERMSLGLTYVAWAQPVSGRLAIAGWTYGTASFDLAELIIRVRIDEVAPSVAP